MLSMSKLIEELSKADRAGIDTDGMLDEMIPNAELSSGCEVLIEQGEILSGDGFKRPCWTIDCIDVRNNQGITYIIVDDQIIEKVEVPMQAPNDPDSLLNNIYILPSESYLIVSTKDVPSQK